MPKFYFHVQTVDGVVAQDTIGAYFDSEEEAIREARDFASGLMREAAERDDAVEHVIEVTDEHGASVARLEYKATLEVQGHRSTSA